MNQNQITQTEAQSAIPSRSQAIAECRHDLEQKAQEFLRLRQQYAQAQRDEIEARVALFRAELLVNYGKNNRWLGIEHEEAIKGKHEAQAALADAVETAKRLMLKKWALYDYDLLVNYPGYDWQDTSNFDALAAAAAEKRWGQTWRNQEAEEIKQRLGLTDNILALLSLVPKSA